MYDKPNHHGRHSDTVARVLASPWTRRLLWVGFAVVFYMSGLAFTIWLLTPDQFEGGVQWVWVILFPLLVPAFFVVNRYTGCAASSCPTHRGDDRQAHGTSHHRPPGI